MAKAPWEAAFTDAVSTRSVDEMLQSLESERTAHAGTPPAAVKQKALKLILRTYKAAPGTVFQLACDLHDTLSPTAHELAAILLAEAYTENPEQAAERLWRLADSDNWEVREWAASACGHILFTHFAQFSSVLAQWAAHGTGNVRRAVALAAMYAAKGRNPDLAEPLLDLVEPLLSDRDPYVRKNLGPFAIGDGLLRYYPEQTLKRAERWVSDADEMVRWNAAAALAKSPLAQAGALLASLHADPSPLVRRVSVSATRKREKKA